jgi:predicted RecA/RadA family phage recombinase
MATNYIGPGATLTVTAPRTLTGGEGCLVGTNLFGVAHDDASSGATDLVIHTCGVWGLTKQAALAISAGARVYWDNTLFEVDTTDTNLYIGVAVASALAADATVRVKLGQGLDGGGD